MGAEAAVICVFLLVFCVPGVVVLRLEVEVLVIARLGHKVVKGQLSARPPAHLAVRAPFCRRPVVDRIFVSVLCTHHLVLGLQIGLDTQPGVLVRELGKGSLVHGVGTELVALGPVLYRCEVGLVVDVVVLVLRAHGAPHKLP